VFRPTAGIPAGRVRAIGSAGERLVHTEEVTGSIPVSPTRQNASATILFLASYNTEVQQPSAVQLAAERPQRLSGPGIRHLGVDLHRDRAF
jgi:hypothetical protein